MDMKEVAKFETKAAPEVQALLDLKELLSDESRWTQHALARDANGVGIFDGALSDDARAWCLLGGLQRVCRDTSYGKTYMAAWGRLSKTTGVSIATFNNTRTHGDVVAAIQKAIAA